MQIKTVITHSSLSIIALALVFSVINPAHAIYDPEGQKNCTPTSTETICLLRSVEEPVGLQQLTDSLSLLKMIFESNVSIDLKSKLFDIIMSSISSKNDDLKEMTSFTYNGGTATLSNGQYSFNLGCNSIFGKYEQTGSAITFGPSASTMMACETDLMQKDTDLVEALAKVNSIAVKNDTVTLTGGGQSIVLTQTK